MKTITLKNVDVVYNVPDEVLIEDGKTLSLFATKVSDTQINLNKNEKVMKPNKPRNYAFSGKNYTITFDADNHTAKGTLTLRSGEDWKAMRSRLIQEFTDGLDELLKKI